ncbi:MAG TPA: hypothetical protein VNH11_29010 [Pirellulales bacterium]|nr:hypothetical protein [Pirellulales bacterium]
MFEQTATATLSAPRSALSGAARATDAGFRIKVFIASVLTVHLGLLAWSATRQSPTVDEVAHLPAGISHWQFRSYSLYAVNPPLVRMIAALPVLCASPRTDWRQSGAAMVSRPEFAVGTDFIEANGERSFWLFTMARWACLPFSALGALVCYRWSADLFGPRAGALALWLWCFSPNVLAHAQLITPDLAATSLGAAACHGFWRWSKRRTWCSAIGAGTLIGLTEITKSTWFILFALLPALWLVSRAPQNVHQHGVRWRAAVQFATMLALALFIMNLAYDFVGSFRPLGSYGFHSSRLGGGDSGAFQARNRFTGRWLGTLRVPFPEDYVQGVDIQLCDLEGGRFSYLRGEMRRAGWWYYYLYAFAIKTPLGTWLLATIALAGALARGAWRAGLRDELVLLLPPASILVLVSSQTGMNQHFRYILPALPFVFILIGRAGRALYDPQGAVRWLVAIAVALSTASSLRVYPYQLSYFNELVGGPERGHEHLLDSNIDWGQDLLELKRWLDSHPEARPLRLAYFGMFDPRIAGIDCDPVPDVARCRLPQGWYALSVNSLYGYGLGGLTFDPRYATFRRLKPVAMAGYSIYIYHVGSGLDESVAGAAAPSAEGLALRFKALKANKRDGRPRRPSVGD